MDKTEIKVEAADSGTRTDVFVADKCGITRSAAQKLISTGSVSAVLNGRVLNISKNTPLAEGTLLSVTIPEPDICEAKPENIPLDIVYEDDDIIIVNKPRGMVVHPAPGHTDGTLVSALLYHCGGSLSGINGVLRPGIVHRIDRDTTGLIAAAKNDTAHLSLASQLADHSMHRIYYAVVTGNPKADCGTVETYIGRHPKDRKKMAVVPPSSPGARNAITHYKVIKRFRGFSLLKLQLETGRTHQIRVHMAHIGHPLAGDTVYGGGSTPFEKRHPTAFPAQLLHAGELTLIHPRTNKPMTFKCDIPSDFAEALRLLEATCEC